MMKGKRCGEKSIREIIPDCLGDRVENLTEALINAIIEIEEIIKSTQTEQESVSRILNEVVGLVEERSKKATKLYDEIIAEIENVKDEIRKATQKSVAIPKLREIDGRCNKIIERVKKVLTECHVGFEENIGVGMPYKHIRIIARRWEQICEMLEWERNEVESLYYNILFKTILRCMEKFPEPDEQEGERQGLIMSIIKMHKIRKRRVKKIIVDMIMWNDEFAKDIAIAYLRVRIEEGVFKRIEYEVDSLLGKSTERYGKSDPLSKLRGVVKTRLRCMLRNIRTVGEGNSGIEKTNTRIGRTRRSGGRSGKKIRY